MSVVDDAAAAAPAAPSAPIPKRSGAEPTGPRLGVGAILRGLVFAALATFLLYYVGPRDIAETTIKAALVVVLTVAGWVGANLLFDQAYSQWTRFNTAIGVILGFVAMFVADANGLVHTLLDDPVDIPGQGLFDDITGWRTQALDLNGALWGLIGGVGLGLAMFLLSAPRQQLARLPLATVAFVAVGFLAALAFDDSAYPLIDWTTVLACVGIGVAVFGAFGIVRYGASAGVLSALTGGAIGWAVGAWGGADIGDGSWSGVIAATVVPFAIVGVRFGLAATPDAPKRRRIDQRSRSWIFVAPTMVFIVIGLLAPLIRTVYLSFRNRSGNESVGWDNYNWIFTNRGSVNFDDWQNIFTSRLFFVALALLALGGVLGVVAGRRTRQPFERSPSSLGPIVVGVFVLSCAVLASIRGTVFNNVWWVIVVTSLATAFGLAVAVLADNARAENAAKSLVFLPMAISFIGAGIIWRFMYQARDISRDQTGVLNALWLWIGETTTSDAGMAVWLVVLGLFVALFAYLIKVGFDTKSGAMSGIAAGFLLLTLYLAYRIIGPGLGGYIEVNGDVVGRPVLFLQDGPFNNMWLMVVLIWVQTGFAMVIFSAAIKAVPTELIEAATVDGANASQVFWRITLPQIAPTIGVVTTALFVTVMKVFDIVYAMTNGNFGTQVIANQMWITAFGQSNLGLGSALAVVLFVSVIPVMWINVRRLQSESS